MPSAVSWRSARKSTLHGRRDRASPIGIGTAQARAVRQRGAGRCVIGELLVQLVALLIDREIERRQQRYDLIQIVLEANRQAARMGRIGQQASRIRVAAKGSDGQRFADEHRGRNLAAWKASLQGLQRRQRSLGLRGPAQKGNSTLLARTRHLRGLARRRTTTWTPTPR